MAENARQQRAGAAALLNDCIRSTERYMKTPTEIERAGWSKRNVIDKQIVLAEKSSLVYEFEELQ